ncbi:hypothetical protein T261_8459 [Streptomyces lydicus]|nr:hypothetical protein T261_8459 [Streptomyces lydicus]
MSQSCLSLCRHLLGQGIPGTVNRGGSLRLLSGRAFHHDVHELRECAAQPERQHGDLLSPRSVFADRSVDVIVDPTKGNQVNGNRFLESGQDLFE